MKRLFTTILAAVLFLFGAASVSAATTVVHPGGMGDWAFLVETGTGAGALVDGPDTPPLGEGSANLTTADGAGGVLIGKLGYEGLAFGDIDSLSYSTYVDPGYSGTVQTIALQFNADDDVTDGDISWKGRLVFEPYYTETVTKGVWQTWDPTTQGKWWGTGAAISAFCSIGSPCTWSELLTALPDVGVNSDFGGVVFKAGSGWPAPFDGNVDAFSIVSAAEGIDETYDFEPADSDNDGVVGDADLCPNTVADDFDQWGKSKGRYMWNGAEWVSSGKGAAGFEPDMDYTHGCSGTQILDSMSETLEEDFGGHYKYGPSKSILEAWNAGVYHVGLVLLETVEVDSALSGGADSVSVLDDENDYFLRSSGTWTNRPGETVDTEYSTIDGTNWTDAPDGGYPANLLDLQVDETFVDWGAYSGVHAYELAYTPAADGTVNLRVFDGDADTNTVNPGWYSDNVGSLSVDIVEDMWVDLW